MPARPSPAPGTPLTLARPADLAPDIRAQVEHLWQSALHAVPGAFGDTDERIATLLGLAPADGPDELTRCDYPGCGAWFWADQGARLVYASGTELEVCAAHAQAHDPGARMYPGAALLADVQAGELAATCARIRKDGSPW